MCLCLEARGVCVCGRVRVGPLNVLTATFHKFCHIAMALHTPPYHTQNRVTALQMDAHTHRLNTVSALTARLILCFTCTKCECGLVLATCVLDIDTEVLSKLICFLTLILSP